MLNSKKKKVSYVNEVEKGEKGNFLFTFFSLRSLGILFVSSFGGEGVEINKI